MVLNHSIIIPFRHSRIIDRGMMLDACLDWLGRSVRASLPATGQPPEVLIVDGNCPALAAMPDVPGDLEVRILSRPQEGIYNKCKALNQGIEAARGDVLTFLDADMLPGPLWAAAPLALVSTGGEAVTKLCYRVRHLPANLYRRMLGGHAPLAKEIGDAFDQYDALRPNGKPKYRIAHEGRGSAEFHSPDGEEQPLYGNSQFTIRREKLGDLRFDEGFRGAGWEDLWMIREIARRHGARYKALLSKAGQQALFHVRHPREDEHWRTPPTISRNHARYYGVDHAWTIASRRTPSRR